MLLAFMYAVSPIYFRLIDPNACKGDGKEMDTERENGPYADKMVITNVFSQMASTTECDGPSGSVCVFFLITSI